MTQANYGLYRSESAEKPALRIAEPEFADPATAEILEGATGEEYDEGD